MVASTMREATVGVHLWLKVTLNGFRLTSEKQFRHVVSPLREAYQARDGNG